MFSEVTCCNEQTPTKYRNIDAEDYLKTELKTCLFNIAFNLNKIRLTVKTERNVTVFFNRNIMNSY